MTVEEKNIEELIIMADKRIDIFKKSDNKRITEELFTQGNLKFWEREKMFWEVKLACLRNKNKKSEERS